FGAVERPAALVGATRPCAARRLCIVLSDLLFQVGRHLQPPVSMFFDAKETLADTLIDVGIIYLTQGRLRPTTMGRNQIGGGTAFLGGLGCMIAAASVAPHHPWTTAWFLALFSLAAASMI